MSWEVIAFKYLMVFLSSIALFWIGWKSAEFCHTVLGLGDTKDDVGRSAD